MVRSPINGNPVHATPFNWFGVEINRQSGFSARVLNPARISFLVAILAIAGAVMAGLDDPWIRSTGVVIAVVAITLQHARAGAVTAAYSADDWSGEGGEFVLLIPRAFHGRRAPTVQVFAPVEPGSSTLQEVGTDIHELPDGTIRVAVGGPTGEEATRTGRVRIG